MTVRVGILGLGFMGNCHLNAYQSCKGVEVAALCDIDPEKLRSDAAVVGNIAVGNARQTLGDVKTYTDAADLLADRKIDVVDVTLPTYLHAEYVIAALQAGKHVICEKPMALDSADGKAMLAAAKKAKRQLFVAQCIRFWPSYAVARKLVQSGKHGDVRSAVFTRLSPRPTWAWQQWIHDPRKSGSAAMDLHIHDADYILYLLGKPKSVSSRACGSKRTGFEHIVTTYEYAKSVLVVGEGAWEYPATFPFSMTFRIVMEKAALELAADGRLMLHDAKGKKSEVAVPAGDGYTNELQHFVDCIARRKPTDIVPPESAIQSVRLIEAELESAATGKPVRV